MVDGLITLAAWLTVLAPFAIVGYLVYHLIKWVNTTYWTSPYEEFLKNDYVPKWNSPMWQGTEKKTTTTTYAHTDPPPGHVEPETTITTTECPEVTSIDKEGFDRVDDDEDEVVDCRKLVDPGKRVYRIYRSDDHLQWIECEPALTERAACNYAQYMKIANPNQFVIAKDPEGLILFYE